jgi:hypothetical protein
MLLQAGLFADHGSCITFHFAKSSVANEFCEYPAREEKTGAPGLLPLIPCWRLNMNLALELSSQRFTGRAAGRTSRCGGLGAEMPSQAGLEAPQ